MAKDGTGRGGARIGAGRKPKPLAEKIVENLPSTIKQKQTKIKNPKSYLTATQKDGTKTFARQIYRETYDWLQKNNCADLISAQLVENFSGSYGAAHTGRNANFAGGFYHSATNDGRTYNNAACKNFSRLFEGGTATLVSNCAVCQRKRYIQRRR